MKEAQGIFSGLKVLDVASFIAAPAAATVLSDFGAEVIKVEPPQSGDPWRAGGDQPGMPETPHNYCWTLESRNKRSLALDLKHPDGQRVLHRLVRDADIFITNLPLASRARLAITYEQLAPLNDRLIYASFTAHGEVGEEADQPGFDTTAWWARSGLMDQLRVDARTPPARSLPGMGDHPTAMAVYSAIVTALYRREKTSKGGCVGSSLLANGVWSNAVFVQAALSGAAFPERPPRTAARNALANHYRCRDGRWLILSLSAAQEDKSWPRFVHALARPQLASDPRFATKAARLDHASELIALLDAVFAERDGGEWKARLAGEGLVAGLVAQITDIPRDRQLMATGALVPMAGAGGVEMTVSSPFWILGEDKVAPRAAPSLGEHTDQILRSIGLSQAEIDRLRASGAVA